MIRPGVFFPETAFCGVWRDRAGYGENSSGLKTRFFLANPSPARKILTFFSPTLPRRGNFLLFFSPWRGIGSFLCILARNLYFWRGICMFWRGETCPGEENFDFFPRQPCPGEENFDFFLASPTPARINSRFFLAGVFPRHKYLLPDDPYHMTSTNLIPLVASTIRDALMG